ncbi:MAG: hypothetical protein MUD06_07120 [Rhodospirillales bacterium]|nr:hypothetical protein [Rhodospirillales bacterium]
MEQQGEDAHEADLPGALPAQGLSVDLRAQTTVDAAACPKVDKADDREIGCAVAYLRAGSPEQFVASIGRRSAL